MSEKVAYANPGPLGLAGFALTTFVLSVHNAGLVPAGIHAMVPLALFYGGLAQLIAGVLEMKTGNTFGLVAFVSYGAFWIALATLVVMGVYLKVISGADFGAALGLTLLSWTIFTAIMTIVAVKHGPYLGTLFVSLLVTFILLVIGHYSGAAAITRIGGWLGIFVAGVAWYMVWQGLEAQLKAAK